MDIQRQSEAQDRLLPNPSQSQSSPELTNLIGLYAILYPTSFLEYVSYPPHNRLSWWPPLATLP